MEVNNLKRKKVGTKPCSEVGTRNITHDRLQSECFKWFWNTYPDYRRLMWMNYNNPKNAKHGATLKALGMIKGVFDLLLYAKGKLIAFEIKIEKDFIKPDQKTWGNLIEREGGQWYEIRSLDQFKKAIEIELQ